jgi:chromate reductase, NAD(P)H dehydrogenase (quinone)
VLILGVSGSLRRGSHNTALLRAAAGVLPAGIGLVPFDALAEIPPFDEDHDREPAAAAVRRLRDAIGSADALLIATPEYNSSIPGQLKNALDWASRPFATNVLRGKPVAVIGASTGPFGAVWAQAELRKVLRTIGARVVERELAIGVAHEAFEPAGRLLDRSNRDSLTEIIRELVEEAEERPCGLAA